jgi:hypothetical protein
MAEANSRLAESSEMTQRATAAPSEPLIESGTHSSEPRQPSPSSNAHSDPSTAALPPPGIDYTLTSSSSVDKPKEASKFQWSVFLAFILSVACVIGATNIIFQADGSSVADWVPSTPQASPSVLLAIVSGLFNTFQGIALAGGVTYQWWCATYRKQGVSLRTLHRIWNKGEWRIWLSILTVWDAFTSDRSVAKVTIAAMFTAVAGIASNPLLQRSIHTGPATTDSDGTWNLAISQHIQDGYTGSIQPAIPGRLIPRLEFLQLVQKWYMSEDMSVDWITNEKCTGYCWASILAAGFSANCTSTESFLDLTADESANATLFSVNFSVFDDTARIPTLLMTTLFSKSVDTSCNATIVTESCELRGAKVYYDISMQNGTLMVSLDKFPRLESLNASVGDSKFAKAGTAAGTLTGLEWIGRHYYQSTASLVHEPGSDTYGTSGDGISATQYSNLDTGTYLSLGDCQLVWQDPVSSVLTDLHQFMFQMAYQSEGKQFHASYDVKNYPH